MLLYFRDNYAWNMAVATLVEDVGTLAEPFTAFTSVESLSGAEPRVANEAWFGAFIALGERLQRLGDRDLAEGNELTAARKYHRASMYFTRADRMMSHEDERKFLAYDRVLENYRKAREYGREGVEFLDIPYKDGAMPSLLIKAPDVKGMPAPIVIQVQGFDSVKETQWPVLQTYRARGVSLLIVDQGGSGGALRLHGLIGEPDAEKYVAKIIDYIMARPDIATDQIGICGISMGGYFAPRAAAYEPRIKACALWGAIPYSPKDYQKEQAANASNASLPDAVAHGLWAWGYKDPKAFYEGLGYLCLKGVIEKITCPLYIVHGENDRQIKVQEAFDAYNAATTPSKKLKIFTKDEGGVEHCQLDNRAYGADTLADWFSGVFFSNNLPDTGRRSIEMRV